MTLAWTAFTVGLLGGLHCVAMCGGFVGAHALRRVARPPLSSQFLFNGGRIASYALAGAAAGGISGAGMAAGTLLPVQTMLFIIANGLLILLGLHLAGESSVVQQLERLGARAWPIMRQLVGCLPNTSKSWGRFAAGVVWGWTPCGLVYSMLALALVSGSAQNGALVMAAFGFGTLPNLLGAGWLLTRFGISLRRQRVRMVAGIGVAAFGVFGLIRIPGLAQQLKEGLLCLN